MGWQSRLAVEMLALAVAATVAMAQGNGTKTGAKTAKAKPAAAATTAGSAGASFNAKGKEVYRVNCAICHFSASSGKKIGPGMKGIFKGRKFEDGTGVTDETMRVWIEKGGKTMPPFQEVLTAQQIADLIAYMKSL